MKKTLFFLLALALVVAFAVPASADVDSDMMMGKLQRGATNALTGVLEIPAQIQNEYENAEDTVVGKLFATGGGVFKGIGMGVARTIGGFFEIATFAFGDGEPLIEPESVFDNWE